MEASGAFDRKGVKVGLDGRLEAGGVVQEEAKIRGRLETGRIGCRVEFVAEHRASTGDVRSLLDDRTTSHADDGPILSLVVGSTMSIVDDRRNEPSAGDIHNELVAGDERDELVDIDLSDELLVADGRNESFTGD